MSKRVTFSRDYGNYVAGQTVPVKDSTARTAIREGAATLVDEPEAAAPSPAPQGSRPGAKPKAKSRRRKRQK